MTELVTRIRRLITDPAGATAVFGDEEIQDALDLYRRNHARLQIHPADAFLPNGATDFSAETGWWERNATLFDAQNNALALAPETDFIAGRFILATAISAGGVWLRGGTYDIYRTAADLLEQWALRLKNENDFRDGAREFNDSQTRDVLLKQARVYRRKQRIGTGNMIAADFNR